MLKEYVHVGFMLECCCCNMPIVVVCTKSLLPICKASSCTCKVAGSPSDLSDQFLFYCSYAYLQLHICSTLLTHFLACALGLGMLVKCGSSIHVTQNSHFAASDELFIHLSPLSFPPLQFWRGLAVTSSRAKFLG